MGVAQKIQTLSKDIAVRLQVFATTHANSVVQYSTSRYFVKRETGSSECFSLTDPAHIDEVWKSGVAPWIHPLLREPGRSLVLFEGRFDFDIFNVVKGFIPGGLELEGYYLGNLDSVNASGGDSRLFQYLQNNVAAIKQREGKGDLHVILDWDSSGKTAGFQGLSNSATYKVSAWKEEDLNPDLSKDFRGIERALSTHLVEEVAAKNGVTLIMVKGKKSIHPAEYANFKKLINSRITKGVSPVDVSFVISFFKKVLT